MSKVCAICGKTKGNGGCITRKGLAKKAGGIGMHVVKNTKRTFEVNLQSVKSAEEMKAAQKEFEKSMEAAQAEQAKALETYISENNITATPARQFC